jgi:hypothetical protein
LPKLRKAFDDYVALSTLGKLLDLVLFFLFDDRYFEVVNEMFENPFPMYHLDRLRFLPFFMQDLS